MRARDVAVSAVSEPEKKADIMRRKKIAAAVANMSVLSVVMI
jgi:hypothetical protein